MLASHWDTLRQEWQARKGSAATGFILVCKNTKIARVLYEWIAEDKPPTGIPSCGITAFRNTPDSAWTIRVDSKVVHETDSAEAKSDESAWMRLTLDTVARMKCPRINRGGPSILMDSRRWQKSCAVR